MSHQSLTGNFLSARVRGALVALAALTISIPSVWADAQSEIAAHLPAGKTILTAKAADLATAVDQAIESSTDFTPAQLAAAAFQPVGGKVRSDRETSAAVVTDSVVALFTSGTGGANPNFASIIGSVVDAVVAVNVAGGNTKLELTSAGQGTVIKDALGTISDGLGTTGTGALAADSGIGAALAQDALLTANTSNLTEILQAGIVGINGVKGKSTADAPVAAELFVDGLLSGGTVPGGTVSTAGYSDFALNILKSVTKNASVDELVAYAVGTKLSGQANLVTLATTLVTKYSTATAKIVQGVTADTTAAVGEVARGSFINALAAALPKDAAAIAQGGSYADPIYSGTFTQVTFAALVTSGGAKLAAKDAAAIATAEGNVLGQDGDMLTQVAKAFAALTGTNTLPPASSATYATDLINGAVKSKIPSTAFTGAASGLGGGTLALGTGKFGSSIPSNETAEDLSSIVNLFAEGILNSTPLSDITAISKEIGTLAEDVAKLVKNESSTAGGTNQPVAAYIAGVLTNVVNSIIGSNSSFTAIQAAISKDVQAAVQGTKNADVKTIVAAAVTGFADGSYPLSPTIGALGTVESPVTNL